MPEDDANRQIANGFLQNTALNERAIQVLPCLRGWTSVIDTFVSVHVNELQRLVERRMVLIIDFDGEILERRNSVKQRIPKTVTDRVFVLGARSNPEELKAALGMSLEDIGRALSNDCAENTRTVWGCELLTHNEGELERLNSSVRRFLFEGQSSGGCQETA